MKRRNFLKKAALGTVGITALGSTVAASVSSSQSEGAILDPTTTSPSLPVVIATWNVK